MYDILSLFDSLQCPIGGIDNTRFAAVTISEYPHFHLAKDVQGLPSLLISVNDDKTRGSVPSIALEHVSVLFDMTCRITKNDGTAIEGNFTVIRCTGRERLLHAYFLRTVRLLFDLLPTTPTKPQVAKAINTLIELFRALTAPPKKSLQGLWAELLLIDVASQPVVLAKAWHSTPNDRFDFNAGNERLEVKSTSQRVRQHHFSLEQLLPIEDTTVVIASMFTEPVGRGVTVIELADRIKKKIERFPTLVEHIDNIVTSTLGENWRGAFDQPFDKQLALSTLAFYEAASIPSVNYPLPLGVSDVHFKSDLSGCEALNISEVSKLNPLMAVFQKK